MVVGAKGGVEDVGEEVGVFEETEDKEVGGYANGGINTAPCLGGIVVHADAQKPTQQGGEDEQ